MLMGGRVQMEPSAQTLHRKMALRQVALCSEKQQEVTGRQGRGVCIPLTESGPGTAQTLSGAQRVESS